MMRLLCLCVRRNMDVFIPPHPTPQRLCLHDSRKDDEVAVPVCVCRNMDVIIPLPPHLWCSK